jgi:hypothetical protein
VVTETVDGIGTANYRPPEQMDPDGRPWHLHAHDVFSCGKILERLKARIIPPSSTTMATALQRVAALSLPGTSAVLDHQLDDMLAKMLEGDPSIRIGMSECFDHPWLQDDGHDSYTDAHFSEELSNVAEELGLGPPWMRPATHLDNGSGELANDGSGVRQAKRARTSGSPTAAADNVAGINGSAPSTALIRAVWLPVPNNAEPRLFVGNEAAARSHDVLALHTISRVVNCTDLAEPLALGSVRSFQFPIMQAAHKLQETKAPEDEAAAWAMLEGAIRFIRGSLAASESVLLYCEDGESRSICLAVAYVMLVRRLGLDDAIVQCRQLHPELSVETVGLLEELLEILDGAIQSSRAPPL